MSPSAWLMLITTWSVVIGVSGYLFWKVLTRPRVEDPRQDGSSPTPTDQPSNPSTTSGKPSDPSPTTGKP